MNSESTTFMKCPTCGAINRVGVDRQCWVCEQNLNERSAVHVVFDDADKPVENVAGVSQVKVVTALIIFGIVGLSIFAPGLGIWMAILSIVPLIRMVALVRPEDQPGRAFGLYVGSFLTSVVIVTIVGITAFGSFCLSLFGVCAIGMGRGGGSDAVAWLLVCGVTGLSVILVCIPLWKWVLHRWRRDRTELD